MLNYSINTKDFNTGKETFSRKCGMCGATLPAKPEKGCSLQIPYNSLLDILHSRTFSCLHNGVGILEEGENTGRKVNLGLPILKMIRGIYYGLPKYRIKEEVTEDFKTFSLEQSEEQAICPDCGNDNPRRFEYENLDFEINHALRNYTCMECGCEIHAGFTLTRWEKANADTTLKGGDEK